MSRVDHLPPDNHDAVVQQVQAWLQQVVVGLNLCPFAAAPMRRQQIRYRVVSEQGEEAILEALAAELHYLHSQPELETSLLILPDQLSDFADYNQFLDWVDALIAGAGWEGVFQVASFHPDYCFAGAAEDDVENWTNRSPYPLLHLIREDRLEAMLDRYPNADAIPETNMETLRNLSADQRRQLFPHCFSERYPEE